MRPLLSTIVALIVLACPAWAGQTAWHEIAPGVQMRLISTGEIDSAGTTLLGLEIDMPETTKTYWRVPGDTGLPTVLDFSGSGGIEGHVIRWPVPTRHRTGDYLDYVYFGHTVLPVEVTVEGPHAHAEIAATLGICSDICIPAQARFSMSLAEAKPDHANALRLRQSLALTPIAWTKGPEPIGDVQLLPDEWAIAVEIVGGEIDPMSLIAATTSGEPLFGAPQKSREPNLVLLPIHADEDKIALDGQHVQLTFMTGMGAFELTRPIEMPPAE
jgi:DsbC/DsbD-like thiol-disulfide interchange protein